VLDYLGAHKLFERVDAISKALRGDLAPLLAHPHVGDIRGLGLLIGVEFVKDKNSREPFPPAQNIAERIHQAALDENVLTYPTQGCVDGLRGDHILLAPPFILSAEESARIAAALQSALAKVFPG
jgi:adenosylmethionine-8-amino-7-oxononanoate aminotransferase